MRIGIDCRTILNPKGEGELAGIGHYTYELVKHLLALNLPAEFVLFFDHRMNATQEFHGPNVTVRQFPLFRYKRYLPFVASHAIVPLALDRDHLDVFHGPANVLPLFYRRPSVVTVHDLAIYRHPSWFPARQQFSTKVLIPSSVRRAQSVIAVSASTRSELLKLFRIPSHRVTTIYEGRNEVPHLTMEQRLDRLRHFRLHNPFVFFVSTLEPRKNLHRLVRAFDRLVDEPAIRKKFTKLDLVVAGANGLGARDLFKTIRSLHHPFRIKRLGYVTQEDKFALLQSAEAFAFPSLWEGFGLPVLEAMACGTPVLSSNISALPEVIGKAGVLVNPEREDEIVHGLRRILLEKDLRADLRDAGHEQVRKFQWEQTAAQTFDIYQAAAHTKYRRG